MYSPIALEDDIARHSNCTTSKASCPHPAPSHDAASSVPSLAALGQQVLPFPLPFPCLPFGPTPSKVTSLRTSPLGYAAFVRRSYSSWIVTLKFRYSFLPPVSPPAGFRVCQPLASLPVRRIGDSFDLDWQPSVEQMRLRSRASRGSQHVPIRLPLTGCTSRVM